MDHEPQPLQGTIEVPADKSISHRSVLFAALADGESRIRVTHLGRDNLASLRIMQQLGVKTSARLTPEMYALAHDEGIANIAESTDGDCVLSILGNGPEAFVAPSAALDCGNSGTTARLLTGILAACPFDSTLTGDESLQKRPFKRVTEPLTECGARFSGDRLPLTVHGGKLSGIDYESPVASAQVKSALLLAGLDASNPTIVTEPHQSRDHTERMLRAMGRSIEASATADGRWKVVMSAAPGHSLAPLSIDVPGDISSAAFFAVAASVVPGSEVTIANVGVNQTRTGVLDILERMGAQIEFINSREVGGEPVADLLVKSAALKATEIAGSDVVRGIDEIPALAIAAACAEGVTRVRDAAELRVKESDRLAMIASLLKDFGVKSEEFDDGIDIYGVGVAGLINPYAAATAGDEGSKWRKSGDHRISMAAALGAFAASGELRVENKEVIETSFPTFVKCFEQLTAP